MPGGNTPGDNAGDNVEEGAQGTEEAEPDKAVMSITRIQYL